MPITLERSEINAILKAGTLTRIQYLELMSLILSGQNLDEDDYRLINQILDRFRLGRISITDS
ncbi:MAG: hypothetical protein EAZ61_08935 [Oscillatoriales cyanobacterium]|jgi:hypothetical protein|nr:MAG: hypothetical protein EAZ61_08935 [Oscillatoriales cyanobacterium]